MKENLVKNQDILQRGATALYYQLVQKLRKHIITGEFAPGDALPIEPQLCEKFGVSRITVRKAVEILENEGLVSRQQGRGTFVRKQNHAYRWRTESVEDLLIISDKTRLELYAKKLIKAPYQVSQDMNIEREARLYRFKGIRIFNGNLHADYCAYVPFEHGRAIDIKKMDSSILFTVVEKVALTKIKEVNQYLYASVANDSLASKLNIKKGAALFVTKRIYFSDENKALLLAITKFPGDFYSSFTILKRM